MTDEDDRDLREPCRSARALVHDRADGEIDDVGRVRLEAHLAVCRDCVDFAEEIDGVRDSLAGLADVPFPDDALREVWARTVEAEPWWRRPWFPSAAWRPALTAVAAAAIAGAALWLAFDGGRTPAPASASQQEMARAVAEARYALALAGGAVRRSERAAVGKVLLGEVGPALERIPVRWPSAEDSRRNGT